MATIPELRVDGLHPDHVGPLQAALAQARELAAVESGEDRRPTKEAGTADPENQRAGSPWDTETVTSWMSPHHQKKGQK